MHDGTSVSHALTLASSLVSSLAARADDHDRDASFPQEDVSELREAGLLGLMVPAELGGMGAGFEDYTQIAIDLAKGNAATALLFNMHAAVTGALATAEENAGTAMMTDFRGVRDEILRGAAAGRMYGVAISERKAGSRLSELRATYDPENGGFRVRAQKVACSGAGHLDGYLVAAVPACADEPGAVVSYLFVPAGPGVQADGGWDPLGMRATASRGLCIDTVVPRRNLLGGVEGLALLLAYEMPQWLVASYAAVYVGVGEAIVEEGARYLADRLAAGSAVSAAMRSGLGRADACVAAARVAVEHAARLVDSAAGATETNRWIYRAKLLAGDAAAVAASQVAQSCGLHALRRGAPLERLYRDAAFGAVMPPRSDVCEDVLGAFAIGMDVVTLDGRPW